MSILFGTSALKFIKDSVTVDLTYSDPEPPGNNSRIIEHESIINAFRSWTNVADHDHIEVVNRLNLFKYERHISVSAARNKYKEIYKYYHQLLDELYFDNAYPPFMDETETPVKFFLMTIQPLWVYNPKGIDVLRLVFKSEKPCDLSKSVSPVVTGEVITDDTDEYVVDDKDEAVTN